MAQHGIMRKPTRSQANVSHLPTRWYLCNSMSPLASRHYLESAFVRGEPVVLAFPHQVSIKLLRRLHLQRELSAYECRQLRRLLFQDFGQSPEASEGTE